MLTLFVGVVAVSIPFLGRLTVDDDYLSYLPTSGRDADDYRFYQANFPSDSGNVVVLTGAGLCTPRAWEAQLELSKDLEAVPGVDRVFGLTTVKYVRNHDGALQVLPFAQVEPDGERDRCDLAWGFKPYQGLFVNKARSAMALYILAKDRVNGTALDVALRKVTQRYRPAFREGFCSGDADSPRCRGDLIYGGELSLRAELARLTIRSVPLLALVVLIMFVAALAQTRSLATATLAACTGILAATFTFAFMGFAEIARNPINSLVIYLLIPNGAMYAIHARGYVARSKHLVWGWLPREAPVPYAFAALTTMVGFAATSLSESPAVQQLGYLGVFGVTMSLFTSFAFVFPILSRLKAENVPLTTPVPPAVIVSRTVAVASIAVIVCLSGLGISLLRIKYSPTEYLDRTNAVRRAIDRTSRHFGMYMVPVMVAGGVSDAAIDPKLMATVSEFVEQEKARTPRLEASALYDVIMEVKRTYLDEHLADVPLSSDAIAQILLFFEPRDLERYLDEARSNLVVHFATPFEDSEQFREFSQSLQAFAGARGLTAVATGRLVQFMRAGERIASENVHSLVLALLLIGICFVVFFRSVWISVLGLIPNVLPIVGSVGVLGLCGVNLDAGNSLCAAIALGLVADNTGHILSRYRIHKETYRHELAVALAARELRMPIMTSTITIVCALLPMNLSALIPLRTFSRLMSLALLAGMFSDLVLFPALLAHFGASRESEPARSRTPADTP